MPDIVDAATRSRMMSGIRGKDTKPEMRVRQRLHAAGFRYRLHVKDLPGKPDLVFSGARTVLFVHGCFWHQHSGCQYSSMPHSNVDFWRRKLNANVDRDAQVSKRLVDDGWSVETFWECYADSDLDELAQVLAARQLRGAEPREIRSRTR